MKEAHQIKLTNYFQKHKEVDYSGKRMIHFVMTVIFPYGRIRYSSVAGFKLIIELVLKGKDSTNRGLRKSRRDRV